MNSAPNPLALEEPEQLVVEPLAGDLVECAERLVEEEDVGLHHQRAGQRGAHLHPAGELLRVLVRRSRSGRRARGSRRPGAVISALGMPCELGEQLDVAAHRAPLQQRRRPGTRSRGSTGRRRRCPSSAAAARRRCAAASTCRSPTARRSSRTRPARRRGRCRAAPRCRRGTSSTRRGSAARTNRWSSAVGVGGGGVGHEFLVSA